MANGTHQLIVTVDADSVDVAINDVTRALVEFGFYPDEIRVGIAPAGKEGE